jgi:hypothetical protein
MMTPQEAQITGQRWQQVRQTHQLILKRRDLTSISRFQRFKVLRCKGSLVWLILIQSDQYGPKVLISHMLCTVIARTR